MISEREFIHGRTVYLVVASFVIVTQGAQIAFAVLAGSAFSAPVFSIATPACMMILVFQLWRRQRWVRWLVGGWCILNGAIAIWAGSHGLLRSANIENSTATVAVVSFMFAGYGLLYVIAGGVLLVSRSLRAYLDETVIFPESPWQALRRGLNGTPSERSACLNPRQFNRDIVRRGSFPPLTANTLARLNDLDRVDTIAVVVRLRLSLLSDDPLQTITRLPVCVRNVYATARVRAAVASGGFTEYFNEHELPWALMALDGYRVFGDTAASAVLARAIELQLNQYPDEGFERPPDLADLTATYPAARQADSLAEVDQIFREINTATLAAKYVRDHMADFEMN